MNGYRRTIRTYYAFRVTTSKGFWLPFSVVYLWHQGYGVDVVGVANSALVFAMVAAEVPAGYVADRIGRRASLAVGNAIGTLCMGSYAFVGSGAGYVALYACWGVGFAFHSAIGDAWLYDLLEGRRDEAAFARVSGRGETAELATSAAAAVAASGLYVVDPALPFLANAALAAAGIPLVAALPATRSGASSPVSVREVVAVLRAQVRRPEIRWLVVYAALFNALFSMTRWIEQPALDSVGFPTLGLGLLYAAFKLVSAGATATTGLLQDRLGPRRFFALLVPVCGLAWAAVAVVPLFVVPVLFLRRVLDRVSGPIRNQYVNDRVDGAARATVLSGVAMVLSLASGGFNAVVGPVAEASGAAPTTVVSVSGVVVAAAAGLLWLTASPIRSPSTPSAAESRSAAGSD